MGKVLIQMSPDADADLVAAAPAAAAFSWPAPPAKAAVAEDEEEAAEEEAAAAPIEVAAPAEPPARPVFFCRYARSALSSDAHPCLHHLLGTAVRLACSVAI
jgi:hypothetical protein